MSDPFTGMDAVEIGKHWERIWRSVIPAISGRTDAVVVTATDAIESYVNARVEAAKKLAMADIEFLWSWRINKGEAFLKHPEDVRAMRELLAGVPLEDVKGFEWVAEARERYGDD